MGGDMKKLYRSRDNKMVLGVCAGIGEYLKVDPTVIRLAWLLLSIPTALFGALILYIFAAIIIPEKPY